MAMTYYVLRDILPFMFMGAVVVINFGVGLFVLLGKSFQQHDELRRRHGRHSNDDLLSDEDLTLRRQVEKVWHVSIFRSERCRAAGNHRRHDRDLCEEL